MKVYKFKINGTEVNPIYGDDLEMTHSIEGDEYYYRRNLSGKIKLIKNEFDWLEAFSVDTTFELIIERLIGHDWVNIYSGTYTKLDCDWDTDDKLVTIKVEAFDKYSTILKALDKEINLLDLLPEAEKLNYFIRPIIQVYVRGANIISCFQSGSNWDEEVITPIDNSTQLRDVYHFSGAKSIYERNVTGSPVPNDILGGYLGPSNETLSGNGGAFKIVLETEPISGDYYVALRRVSDDELLYGGVTSDPDGALTLQPVSSEYTGEIYLYTRHVTFYQRLLLASETFNGLATEVLPLNDMVESNRNYPRAYPFNADLIEASADSTVTANKYGRNDAKMYFAPPTSILTDAVLPTNRSSWLNVSYWFNMTKAALTNYDLYGRKLCVLNDAYLVGDVIKKLLAKFVPALLFDSTSEYSEFLFGAQNPVSTNIFTLLITPKTNIFYSQYDKAAQNAVITLGSILELLKVCFKCYWHIEGGKLRIEHVSWYRNGRQYGETPVAICIDTTTTTDAKNKKQISLNQNNYKYDKADLVSKIEYEWMDKVSHGFTGFPIEILNDYIKAETNKKLTVSKFSSDIDYIISNYSDVSKDGYVVFAAVLNTQPNEILYKLPIISRTYNNEGVELQNGFMSWLDLHAKYLLFDLPGSDIKINDVETIAILPKQLKRQEIQIPSSGLNMAQLIKTPLGNGFIEKATLNLSSLYVKITLRHDTGL